MAKKIWLLRAALLLPAFLFCNFLFSQELPQNRNERQILATTGGADSDLNAILAAIRNGENGALKKYCDYVGALDRDPAELAAATSDMDGLYAEIRLAAKKVAAARRYAGTALGNLAYDDAYFRGEIEKALFDDFQSDWLSVETVELIATASRDGKRLRQVRDQVLDQLQQELRRGKTSPGTRLAWGMLRVGMGNPDTILFPASFRYDDNAAAVELVHEGVRMRLAMTVDDYDRRISASVDGFQFTSSWPVLFQKPLGWMALTAKAMRRAGVSSAQYPEWEVMEGPGGVIAVTPAGAAGGRQVFFENGVHSAAALPAPAGADRMALAFREAARALHEGVMSDSSIPQSLRQALRPVLMGTYLPIDSWDYFDAEFCRRLIEANYLEEHITPMPAARAAELAAYREALSRMEAGFDEFAVNLGEGRRLSAVVRPDFDPDNADKELERDMETGEILPRYTWRVESPEKTVFYSVMPTRYLYAFSLAEHFPGRHRQRPAGAPALTEVWHAVLGPIASYRDGDDRAEGRDEDWIAAIVLDTRGRRDPSSGPMGWNFPPHVLQRDDQGDPLLLATSGGVVRSPDLSGIADADARREAADAWLDEAASILTTPGELGLIYHHFFRYTSDSPLPEMPNLIGSHYGLSDTHQTVYQSLDRRWAGRLIGDCDDLAEFFQVLTARQGKLSHVMQVPAHAAAGYVEKLADDKYQFVVLQTGPVLQFVAPSLNEVVEKAYRHFETDGGRSHFTSAAVPLLLRFADEDTRTPFVLSSRIYEDRDYAEAMIRVQGHWHLHTFSAGVREMERMLETDREVGSIKELASLYERVGRYEDSDRLRREELTAVAGDPQATLSTLLDIAQLHFHAKNELAAAAALGEAETLMLALLDEGKRDDFVRVMAFRAYWANLVARLGEPDRAWRLMKTDVDMAKRRGGRLPEATLRTLVGIYDRMAMDPRNAAGDTAWIADRDAVAAEIDAALASGYFKDDDTYNTLLRRYFVIGRYAVAREGRAAGLERLLLDGPYPEGPKDHVERGSDIGRDDWRWFRIMPQLYLQYGLEMIDRDDFPEFYDPDTAKVLLEGVARAVTNGAGLGADVIGGDDLITSELILSFLNHDLDAYVEIMTRVRDRGYASLYDDAALAFGSHCGFIPPEEFAPWVEAFHQFFPGRQNYFKAVYRALDKDHLDHALMLARATAGFFPDEQPLVDEAAYVEQVVPVLRERSARREAEKTVAEERPAA